MALLNIDSNPKTVKGQKRGFMTAVLYLAPYSASGINVCPMAEIAGCVAGCLNTAGRGGVAPGSREFISPGGLILPDNSVQRARIARTRWFIEDRQGFMLTLVGEIAGFIRKATKAGLTPVVRLNGTSDIRWEDIPVCGFPNIFAMFSEVQFYDYTKIPNRRVSHIGNYHLSFSYSGVAGWDKYAAKARANMPGVNMVVVFRKELPESFMGLPVVNGDESDLRFLDPKGVVVGLKAKGKASKDTSGFVID